jgi:hypothetical protein
MKGAQSTALEAISQRIFQTTFNGPFESEAKAT